MRDRFSKYYNKVMLAFLLWAVLYAPAFAQTFSFSAPFYIGKTESDSTQYLFSGPKAITTDSKGRVYIADGNNNAIRVFDQQGHYLTSVGRRGRGPGEFLSIQQMSIDDHDNLYVLDRLSRKVTVYSNDLNDHNDYLIKALSTGPIALYHVSDNENLILAAGTPSENTNLAYIYDHNFQKIKANFLPAFPTLFEQDNYFYRAIVDTPDYNSTIFGDGYIALCSEFFSGKIAIFNPESTSHSFYTVGKWNENNYTILDWKKRNQYLKEGRDVIITSIGGGLVFETTSSEGLVGNKNYLVNFYAPLKDNTRISMVRIYDKHGILLATQKLNDTDLRLYKKNGHIGLIPKYMDENNKIYIADYTRGLGFPVVRVVKMKVQK